MFIPDTFHNSCSDDNDWAYNCVKPENDFLKHNLPPYVFSQTTLPKQRYFNMFFLFRYPIVNNVRKQHFTHFMSY